MKYKITIVVEREDEVTLERVYDYSNGVKNGVDYNEKIEDIINTLEKEL